MVEMHAYVQRNEPNSLSIHGISLGYFESMPKFSKGILKINRNFTGSISM